MLSFKTIDRCLLLGIKAVIFLIPVLPLYVSTGMVFPYITGKNFAFRILVEFAAALWLVLIAINKEYRLRNSRMTLSILTFTFVIGLADLLGVSPYNSFWSNYERMEGYITILHLALYFMIVKSVMETRKDWMILFNICVVVSALGSIYALAAPDPKASQFAVIYGSRIYGTLGNPPFLASYLLLSVFLALWLIFNTKKLFLKFGYLLIIVINFVAVYLSSSRGAIIGAVIGALMFSMLYMLQNRKFSKEKLARKVFLSVIGASIILSMVFLTLRNEDFIKNDRTLSRFAAMPSDASVQSRFSAWKMAWEGIKERPILGWGQENFIGVYTVNPIPYVREQIWLDRGHNIVIDMLINAGLLGLLAYMTIFVMAYYIIRIAFQKNTVSKNEALTLFTALTAYFIQNLFTFDTINTYLLFFTLLSYIDSLDYPQKVPALKGSIDFKKIKITFMTAIMLASLIISLAFYYVNYKPIRESQLIIKMGTPSDNDNWSLKLINDFNNALSLETFGDAHVRQVMKSISYQIIKNLYFGKEEALKFIEITINELERGISSNRHNLKYLTDVILFYKEVAIYEPSFIARTEALINECIHINPQYQWPYMALADVQVLKKDYKSAFVNVKKIVDMDPQNDKKQLKLALAAILASREDVVSRSLENVSKIRQANNTRAYGEESAFSALELYQIAGVYKKADKLHKALDYYKQTISLLPLAYQFDLTKKWRSEREANIHYEIALTYLALGDKDNAVKEAEIAADINPENFARKAEDIIYSLNR
jgi:O-antigen ligase/tetratricopeptide (TPR) repeat protein